MITINNKVDCCGCNACGDACHQQAISYHTDNEGFWYPQVDTGKCNNCGLCEKVCPMIQTDKLKHNNITNPICFAAQNKNLESLFNSTSGSAFAALAEGMYKLGGYVGGAIFDKDYSVIQFISSNKADLEKLRNSKYSQSRSDGFYLAVYELLKQDKNVLVCGLPCQMAALRSFLGRDYENLIIVDLICLGINSPKILSAYLKWQEEKHNSKIIYYKAKNKEFGWRELTTKIIFENGDVEYDKRDTNYFTHGFISTHTFSRPSCYECKFKGFPRFADITIGDFWGAEKHVGIELDHNLGTSIVMINSKKGAVFYENIRSKFIDKEISLDAVIQGNEALVKSLPVPSIDRTQFYADLNAMPFVDFAKKYIHISADRKLTAKDKRSNIVTFVKRTMKVSGLSLKTWYQNIYYNLFCKQVKANVLEGKYLNIYKNCILDISKGSIINVDGLFRFGLKRIKGSKLESRLLVETNSTLNVGSGTIAYGADIEVFQNATLDLGKRVNFNIGATIICGDHISIGDDVCFGRNVTVRDNNGNHYISRKFFKNKRPVFIGQHSWITEQCIIMPGAKIGVGVIVSAGSIVSGKLKSFSMATGRPAQVVDEDVFWKA